MRIIYSTTLSVLLFVSCNNPNVEPSASDAQAEFRTSSYDSLVSLFERWRDFEKPPLFEGAPDYRAATFDQRRPGYEELRGDLESIDTTGWSIPEKVDWMIVWAEMNGYDFNQRILKPWERDPAYYKTVWTYKSDVPAHEGPTHHATLELWTYEIPLNEEERQRLLGDLAVIPALNEQAKTNLTGNARDLWITGIRDIRGQAEVLQSVKSMQGVSEDDELITALDKAIVSTEELVSWLEKEAETKDGPSGIGKDNYSWYQQNVHLVPLSWEEEVAILERELARAWTALKFEEHLNRDVPQLVAADSPEAYDRMAQAAADNLLEFLDTQEIVTVKPYFRPALEAHLGEFVPESERNFFVIGEHFDPRPLYSHFYHWFELARMENEPNPSPIRRGPLLYNIFDSRNEGTATAVEEMFLQAGLYQDSPRSREIVYIMIAQRAARGLGSLYAHANMMTMEEAGGIHSEYTPRGWMKTEKELLIFEQHLYLRQPGYGTSYITGKHLLEVALSEYARKLELEGKPFVAREFFDTLNSIGNIPISLGQWEMTGENGHMDTIINQ